MNSELYLAFHGATVVRIDRNANVLVESSSEYVFCLLTQMELNYVGHIFTAVLN